MPSSHYTILVPILTHRFKFCKIADKCLKPVRVVCNSSYCKVMQCVFLILGASRGAVTLLTLCLTATLGLNVFSILMCFFNLLFLVVIVVLFKRFLHFIAMNLSAVCAVLAVLSVISGSNAVNSDNTEVWIIPTIAYSREFLLSLRNNANSLEIGTIFNSCPLKEGRGKRRKRRN